MPREAAYFLLKIGVVVVLLFGLAAVCAAQVPTPTPGTAQEWAEWLEEASDLEVILTEDYDPVVTYAGSHAMPRRFVKQSRKAGVAVEFEYGYTEATSPIDPAYIGGLRLQGEVVTDLVDPVLTVSRAAGAGGSEKKPDQPGPRPTPPWAGNRPGRRPPEIGTVIPGQGRVRDVIVSREPVTGGERKTARSVPSYSLLDGPIEVPEKIIRTPWHSSYQVFRGPVWVKVEVEE